MLSGRDLDGQAGAATVLADPEGTRVPGIFAGRHACGFVLARLKSNCLSEVHSALRVREQDCRPSFPASPIVPTLDLDQLIGLHDGARKESITIQ